MDEAFKDADIIYAKSWGAMVTTADQDRRQEDPGYLQELDHR